MNFKGRAKRIEDVDLNRVGHMIGVGEDVIHAILDVESSGSGFDSKGRPKMLFEPHIFYRQLKGNERTAAVAAGLARKGWRRDYPKDSYPRLERAMKINKSAALKSASFGLGQIMGFNHAAAGYETVLDMVTAFMDDEDNHLEAMIRFIMTNELDDELRRLDWAGFARGYNGAGYAGNRYDTRLKARYEWWQGKPDTPWSPQDAEDEEKAVPVPDSPGPAKPAPAAPQSLLGRIWSLIMIIFGRRK